MYSFQYTVDRTAIPITRPAARPKRERSAFYEPRYGQRSLPMFLPRQCTYEWQLRYDNSHQGQEVDDKICQVVVSVVGAEEEKHDGHRQEELLGWCILVAIVDLLPHIQMVVGSCVELKRYTSHPMEHQVRAGHVGDVDQGPGDLLGHTRNNVVEYLETKYYDGVNSPCTCS